MIPHTFYCPPNIESHSQMEKAVKCVEQGESVIFHRHGSSESCSKFRKTFKITVHEKSTSEQKWPSTCWTACLTQDILEVRVILN